MNQKIALKQINEKFSNIGSDDETKKITAEMSSSVRS
jgi:hypothetical protein